MNIREFSADEIGEINNYVSTQIPNTLLPTMFVLTDNIEKKIKVFLTAYRIMEGAMALIEKEETKNKIKRLLDEIKEIYDKISPLQAASDTTNMELKKLNILRQTTYIIEENKDKINKTITYFLVFADKQELISTNALSGLNLDIPEGKEIYDKLITKV